MADPIIHNGLMSADFGSWYITSSGGADGRGNACVPFNPDEQEMFTFISNGDDEWMLEIKVVGNRLEVTLSASHGDDPFTGWEIPLPEKKVKDPRELHQLYAETIHVTECLKGEDDLDD